MPARVRARADAHTMVRRFPEAAALYARARDDAGLQRLLRIAMDFGRYRGARAARDAGAAVAEDSWRAFLRERALPCVPIGGDARRGFAIDMAVAREIAAELGEPLEPLLGETARRMRAAGSRNLAKLFVYARIAGDGRLAGEVEDELAAIAAHPRARLGEVLAQRLAAEGGEIVETMQAPDGDDHDPKVAGLFLVKAGGRTWVAKEHLRLHVDYSRVDGYSQEMELLQAADHPAIVRIGGVLRAWQHEILLLERAPGRPLSESTFLTRGDALRIVTRLAEALEHLHHRRIAWLDVKPRNVLRAGTEVTLVDFGMARRIPPGEEEVATLASTPEYVPPEIASRFRAGTAADVFQLGLLLFRLRTGRHAFATADAAGEDDPRASQMRRYALASLWREPKLDEPAIAGDPPLQALLRRMLEKDPAKRPSAGEGRCELGGLIR